ncbi:hypothetical protein FA15DRAFT_67776 [Coprinopsis marcescibilis]|uniref:F-box domain-containing protein n=1 Tax=Coprinopsis marcescibilis TaxID=230819 RepID=A0A5C3KNB9_COPMA|nr:hypothetical protein FA15DRAFT_67776 [Coprinopsis marcescibilis]
MPTFNDLATELVHRIIECLRDDRNSLRVLSQVSTAFHKPCRRITFSSLVFTTPRRLGNPKPNSQKLLCLLEAAPELADPEFPAYVTELTIIDGYYELVDDDSDIATRRPGWLTQDDGFPGALRMLNLTGLKRLDLRAIWSLITPEAKGLIADLCRSPSLVSLRIGEETPLRIINFCGPSLKRLTLGNVDFWSDEEELDGVQGAPAIKIDYLRLLDNVTDDGSKDMLLQFLSGVVYRIDLSGLKTLSTGSVLESGTHGIDNYLLSRMGSLETLSLGPIRVTETGGFRWYSVLQCPYY